MHLVLTLLDFDTPLFFLNHFYTPAVGREKKIRRMNIQCFKYIFLNIFINNTLNKAFFLNKTKFTYGKSSVLTTNF